MRERIRRSGRYLAIVCGIALLAFGAADVAVAQFAPARPAAVPDAVRMPRPTSAEVETARRSLEGFLRTADAETRAILSGSRSFWRSGHRQPTRRSFPTSPGSFEPSTNRTWRSRVKATSSFS